MTATYAYTNQPASPSKPQYFSKLEWHRRVRAEVRPSGHVVAEVLRETVGRCRPDENVFCSVVFRTLENLRADAGLSYRTFARRRDEFVELGYLLEVDSGCGPQRYFVLKFPEWTVFDALEYAARSLREMCKLPGQTPQYVAHIRKKVLPAVQKEWKRQVALESFDDPEDLEVELAALESGCDPDQVTFGEYGVVREDPPAGLQELWAETPADESFGPNAECNLPKMQNAFSLYREPTESPMEVGDSSYLTRAREASEYLPPTPSNSGGLGLEGSEVATSRSPDVQTSEGLEGHDTIELDRYRRLRRVFIAMFAQFERRLDPGCASRLAKLYLERGAWPEALAETLDEKLTRLFGDGFGLGQVVRFVTNDVDEWTPPPGMRHPDELAGLEEEDAAREARILAPTFVPFDEAFADVTPAQREDAKTLWRSALHTLSGRVSDHLMRHWFAPLRPAKLSNGVLTLVADDAFRRQWLVDNYAELLADACGSDIEIVSLEE